MTHQEDFCNDPKQVAACSKLFEKLEEKIDGLSGQLQALWRNGLSSLDRRVAVVEEQHTQVSKGFEVLEQETKALRLAVTQHGVTLRLILWIGGMITATTVGLAAKALVEALTK